MLPLLLHGCSNEGNFLPSPATVASLVAWRASRQELSDADVTTSCCMMFWWCQSILFEQTININIYILYIYTIIRSNHSAYWNYPVIPTKSSLIFMHFDDLCWSNLRIGHVQWEKLCLRTFRMRGPQQGVSGSADVRVGSSTQLWQITIKSPMGHFPMGPMGQRLE